ncbi:hypothetical protein RvY_05675 [Ramazzottius varieornatus]|uniref:Uncharacterized protein n=1 Tax=Ramazzottius varieornatus TaxID=947166 RepID=A0A1D1UVV1_RAMVA|nr:hypothetical protein RvY_05675 [Ramazzottius varieornatus]
MIPNELHSFCFSSWYPKFKHVTFPSEIIPLEDAVVAFLREDGMQLPAGLDSHTSDSANYAHGNQENVQSPDWSSEDEEEEEVYTWVTNLKSKVEKAVAKLGGQVFPKLNFTSPRDASWILPNRQLKCTSLTDVLLLLKASSLIQYDLSDSIRERGFIRYEMVLRRWMEFSPGWEYRCFVKDNRLVGISQRNCSDFYAHNLVDSQDLAVRIKSFFERFIQHRFPLNDYVFDIVTFATTVEHFRLVDFNPFDKVTDPGLFVWEELRSAESVPTDELLRVIREPTAVQPSVMRQYEIPADFANSGFSTNGRNLFEFLQDQRSSIPETDSEEEA